MNRKNLRKLYVLEKKTDPLTGREKKVARYVGPTYELDVESRNAVRVTLICLTLAAAALFVAGGMVNNPGSRSFFVMPFWCLTLLPVFYLAMAVFHIARMKSELDEVDRVDGLESAQNSAMGLTVLGAIWCVADIVFLCMGGAAGYVTRELIFLVCGAAMCGIGLWARLAVKKIKIIQKTKEKQLCENMDEKDEKNHQK